MLPRAALQYKHRIGIGVVLLNGEILGRLGYSYVGAGDVYSDIGEFGVAQHIHLAEILKEASNGDALLWQQCPGTGAI